MPANQYPVLDNPPPEDGPTAHALNIIDARIADTNEEIASIIRSIRSHTEDIDLEPAFPTLFPSRTPSQLSKLALELHTMRAVRAALHMTWYQIAKSAQNL